MGRSLTGTLMQIVGAAAAIYFAANYSDAGKDLIKKMHTASEAMHLRTIGSMLDTYATGSADEDDPARYPQTYDEFCALMIEEHPGKGEHAYCDRWGTKLWYQYQWDATTVGYALGSAGPDKKWKTKDDLWVGRWGNENWTRNLGAAQGDDKP